ncbi:hypothetical protein CEK28_08485 [Xenophilus sp. AP218F]|nr:hypothetical protein CEK28_08485 [Xenophilus sp. AP218F]
MKVQSLGAHRVRILDGAMDREHEHGFIRSFGWVDDRPAMFIERAIKPGTRFIVPLDKAYMFATPGALPKLFKGKRPVSPATCAHATAQCLAQLGLEFTPMAASQIIDVVQHGLDRLFVMVNWSMYCGDRGEQDGKRAVGEAVLKINGEVAHQIEVRV